MSERDPLTTNHPHEGKLDERCAACNRWSDALIHEIPDPPPSTFIDRDSWPVPDNIKGASGRDAFLWYIAQAWPLFFGGDEEAETVFYHDFGHHVLRRGSWQLTLVDLEYNPDARFGEPREVE